MARRVLLLSTGFAIGLALSAIAIHAAGYRRMAMPPVEGTATMARDVLREFPETGVHYLEQAERLRRHAAPWREDG